MSWPAHLEALFKIHIFKKTLTYRTLKALKFCMWPIILYPYGIDSCVCYKVGIWFHFSLYRWWYLSSLSSGRKSDREPKERISQGMYSHWSHRGEGHVTHLWGHKPDGLPRDLSLDCSSGKSLPSYIIHHSASRDASAESLRTNKYTSDSV